MKRAYLSLFVGVSLVFPQAHAGEGLKAIEEMCSKGYTNQSVQKVRKVASDSFLEGMKRSYTQKEARSNFLLDRTFSNQVLFRDSDQPGLAGYPMGPAPKINFLSLLERKMEKYGARAAMLEDLTTRDPKALLKESFSSLASQKNPKNPSQKVAEYAAILEHLEEREAPPKGKFDTYFEERDDISHQFENMMLEIVNVNFYNRIDSIKFICVLSSIDISPKVKVHRELFPLDRLRDERMISPIFVPSGDKSRETLLFQTPTPLAEKLQEKFLELKKDKGSSEPFSKEEYRAHLPLYSPIIMDHCYELFVDPTQEAKTFLQERLDKWKTREQVALSETEPNSSH